MSEIELLRMALWGLGSVASVIGSALIWVVIWNAKAGLAAIAKLRADLEQFQSAVRSDVDALRKTLQDEMRAFDRRLTRLEARSGVLSDEFEREEKLRRINSASS